MLKTIAFVFAALVAALLAYAAMQPDTFRVERSIVVNAPPERVHALVNDFHAWQAWSPWEKLDPALKRTFGGPASGVGATYAWEGDSKVGAGRMEITGSTPGAKVLIKLDFLKPIEGHHVTDFTFTPEGAGTRVNWLMTGPSPFISKLFGVIFNIGKQVGGQFEEGLGNLKAVAEKEAAAQPAASAPTAGKGG